MKPSPPESGALWKSLEKTIQEQRTELSSGEFSGGVRHSLWDRISELFLNGTVPLILLQILLLSFGGSSHSIVTWVGVLLSPILALVLRPLCTSHLGLSLTRFLAVGVSLLVVLPVTQFLPELTWNMYKADFWIPDRWDSIFAEAAQRQLEAFFEGPHLLLFSLALFGLMLLCWQWSLRCPWIDHRSRRLRERAPATALYLVPIFLLLWVHRPDAAQSSWRLETEPKYRETFLGQLQQDGESRAWRELAARLEELPGALSDKDTEKVRGVEAEARELLEQAPPRNRKELRAAQLLFQDLRQAEYQTEALILDSPLAADLALMSPVFDGSRGSVGILPDSEAWLESKERRAQELEQAQLQVKQVLKSLPSSVEDLELKVYDEVYGGSVPGLLPIFHGITPKGKHTTTTARLAREKPLKLGPWSIEFSPLNLLLKEQRRTYLRCWLHARAHFAKGISQELRDELRLKVSWKPEHGAQAYYNTKFATHHNDVARRRLESIEVFLRVRLYQLEHGVLPLLSNWAEGWEYEGKRLFNSELSESWRLP